MQKNYLRTLAFTLLCSFLSSCSSTTKPIAHEQTIKKEGKFEVIPVVGDFVAKRAKLANGLTLIVLKDTSSPTFAYQTWFKVGSRDEVRGKTGLAHLFEHMMFKGTKKYKDGEFDALLDKAGAEGMNAYTNTDHTVYIQELPKDKLDFIAELESDRMVNLIVNDESFNTEREVVKNERRFRKENSPEGTLYETLFETAYTTHPYHWPVIGYEQDLNVMNAQDARDFYERYYSPDQAVIVVVGDVNENEVYRRIEKYYGSLNAKNTPPSEIPAEPEQTAQRRKRLSLNLQVEKLWMAFKVPGADAVEENATFEVIQGLLTDGMNSRLNRALVDSGISTNVSSGSFGLTDPGLFVVMTDLQKGKGALLAESVIQRELARLKSSPVSEDELKRAKNLIRFHFYGRMASASGKAQFLGEAQTRKGGVESGIELNRKIDAVTPEMIQTVASKYFDNRRLTVIIGAPKK